ncbi:hypothetical protein Celaphus_00004532, partial [Cervus elaphus hippelaphus]
GLPEAKGTNARLLGGGSKKEAKNDTKDTTGSQPSPPEPDSNFSDNVSWQALLCF